MCSTCHWESVSSVSFRLNGSLFVRSLARSLILLCSLLCFVSTRARRPLSSSLSVFLSRRTTSLVQPFRRLKGPQYIRGYVLCDTRIEAWLFKAGKQARHDTTLRFPLGQEIANVTWRLPRVLIFRQRFSSFPSASAVSFTCPLSLLSAASTRREEQEEGTSQPPRGRFSTARSVSRSIRHYTRQC